MSWFLGELSDKDIAKVSYVMSQQLPSTRKIRNGVREVGSRGGKGKVLEEGNRKENGWSEALFCCVLQYDPKLKCRAMQLELKRLASDCCRAVGTARSFHLAVTSVWMQKTCRKYCASVNQCCQQAAFPGILCWPTSQSPVLKTNGTITFCHLPTHLLLSQHCSGAQEMLLRGTTYFAIFLLTRTAQKW